MRAGTFLALALASLLPAVADAQPNSDPKAILTLQWENSSISASNPTDRQYTNGLRVEWTSPIGQVPGFLRTLGQALWGEGQQRLGIGISQQIYTPFDTGLKQPNPFDRPYAGYLTSNLSLLSDTEDHRSILTLSLGVVGPGAGGENLQNWFHHVIGQTPAQGWNAQIPNTPAIQLLHERTWRVPITSIGALETDFLPALTAGIGTVRTYLQAGGTLRIGQGLTSDFGVPRVRPGLSGADAYTPAQPFAWYLFVGANGQAVAYDVLLQSSPFRSGPHVNPVWDVGEIQAGAAIMAYGLRFTFAYVIQTQEFQGQSGGLHQFGSASIAMRF